MTCTIARMDWTANPPTGRKRPPGDDDLQSEQPLSKKLAMLSLHLEEKNRNHQNQLQGHRTAPRVQDQGERMEVDNDNSNVVFVHNLDDELSSDDEDDKGIVFLPDIEKKLTRVPYDIARGGGDISQLPSGTSTALVLYTVPSSLTVSEEQDGVRRAIIEARARIRQKQVDEVRSHDGHGGTVENDEGGLGESDPDTMDIE